MRFPPVTKEDLLSFISLSEDDDTWALAYTLQLGRVVSAIGLLEQTTVTLLLLVSNPAGSDIVSKQAKLRSSTFGQLVTRLGQVGVSGLAFGYLRKINYLRNDFVHSWFWDFSLPGEQDIAPDLRIDMIGTLENLWKHFRRAEILLSRILCRAGVVGYTDLGDAGHLIWPKDVDSIFSKEDYLEVLRVSGRI